MVRRRWLPSSPLHCRGHSLSPSRPISKLPPPGSLPSYLKHRFLGLRLKARGLGLTVLDSRPASPGHPSWTLTTCGGACWPRASLELAWNSPSEQGDRCPLPGPQEDQPEVHLPTGPEQVRVTVPTSRRADVEQGLPRQAGVPAGQVGVWAQARGQHLGTGPSCAPHSSTL